MFEEIKQYRSFDQRRKFQMKQTNKVQVLIVPLSMCRYCWTKLQLPFLIFKTLYLSTKLLTNNAEMYPILVPRRQLQIICQH